MTLNIHITFDRAAPARLTEYAAEYALTAFTLVADRNTYAVLGQQVEVALRSAGLAVEVIVLPGGEVVPDEGRIVHILMRAPVQTCYLAVGSGVITDLTRFVSYHTRNRFISLPTAPSMDGYATSSNALTIGGLKQSIAGQAPEAIFCDIGTLAAAPRPLIAAGLGDTLAKFTSVNDLRLGHLLWDERWDEAIGQRMENLAHAALVRGDEIARADADAVALLTRSLLDSGLEMAAFGSSAPGGGSEHHISHCWEMRMLQAKLPPLLHGLKVGVGTVVVAGWYARLREMSWIRQLAAWPAHPCPTRRRPRRSSTPSTARSPIRSSRSKHSSSACRPERWSALKQRILDRWDDVQATAARVPAPEAIAAALRSAGGPATAPELGLSEAETELATDYGHFTRPRFTIAKLRLLLGL